MIKISVGRGGQFKGSETDIIKGFVIDDLNSIRIFYKLMDR